MTTLSEKRPVRVLLVDDDEDDYVLTRDLLQSNGSPEFQIDWAQSFDEALQVLRAQHHDVCLVDYRLGQRNGIQLFAEAARIGFSEPMILLTGNGSRQVDLEAMEAGAADYLEKGELSSALLERTIRYAIERNAHLQALREKDRALSQTQKMEAVGRLVSEIAHNFNNSLMAIMGYTAQITESLEQVHNVREDLEQMEEAASHAASVARRLLNIGRRGQPGEAVVELSSVVGRMYELLRPILGSDVVGTLALADEPIYLRCEVDMLEQSLINLCINARDAMPEGGCLTLSTELREDANRTKGEAPSKLGVLRVEDTGDGIPADVKAHIFEPFFTTKGKRGTGLGLSTLHRFVTEDLGGRIEVDSEPGRGTAFEIMVPLYEGPLPERVEAPARGPEHASAAVEREAEEPSPRARVLVVDDQPFVRRLVARVLGKEMDVLQAANGAEALEMLKHEDRIDVLLTDIQMPEIKGHQLARRARRMHPDLEVLFMSGYPIGHFDSARHQPTAEQFVQKPMPPEVLRDAVRQRLARRSRG